MPQIFRDDWRQGLEIKFEPLSERQKYYCKGRCPKCGDLIHTHGPTFVITSVQRESSTYYAGYCTPSV